MDIVKLVVLAKQVAKPWAILCYFLAVLLGFSVVGNVYQATRYTTLRIQQTGTNSQRIPMRVPNNTIRVRGNSKVKVG